MVAGRKQERVCEVEHSSWDSRCSGLRWEPDPVTKEGSLG